VGRGLRQEREQVELAAEPLSSASPVDSAGDGAGSGGHVGALLARRKKDAEAKLGLQYQ
jgi:hypothetical protein